MSESGKNTSDMLQLAKDFPMFKDTVIRVDEVTQMASVLDVIRTVLGNDSTARSAWKSIRDTSRRIHNNGRGVRAEDGCHFDLNGVVRMRLAGSRSPTPVAPFSVLLEIVYMLPGKHAQSIRQASAKYISRLLAGDLTLIDEIETRYENSTKQERVFYKSGIDETPAKKLRREEMEEDRLLNKRLKLAEVVKLELENRDKELKNRDLEMTGILRYKDLLAANGLNKDPRLAQTVNDAIANILIPTTNTTQASEPQPTTHLTVAAALSQAGITSTSSAMVGKRAAELYRLEHGRDPGQTRKYVNGETRLVNVYEAGWLRKALPRLNVNQS